MSLHIIPEKALADNLFDDACHPWIGSRGLFGEMAGLPRVSTREQSYGSSPDAQQDEIESLATRYHGSVEAMFRIVESNTHGPRARLQAALDQVHREGLTLVVCSLDRVTKQDLETTGGDRDIFVIVSELGRIVDRAEVLSEAYRKRQRSIATKRSMQFLKRQGKHVGRPFKQNAK